MIEILILLGVGSLPFIIVLITFLYCKKTCYNKFVTEDKWYNSRRPDGKKLFNDKDGSSYKRYLESYNQYQRDQKINEILK